MTSLKMSQRAVTSVIGMSLAMLSITEKTTERTEEADAILTPAAEKFGEVDLYVGDDGLIYG